MLGDATGFVSDLEPPPFDAGNLIGNPGMQAPESMTASDVLALEGRDALGRLGLDFTDQALDLPARQGRFHLVDIHAPVTPQFQSPAAGDDSGEDGVRMPAPPQVNGLRVRVRVEEILPMNDDRRGRKKPPEIDEVGTEPDRVCRRSWPTAEPILGPIHANDRSIRETLGQPERRFAGSTAGIQDDALADPRLREKPIEGVARVGGHGTPEGVTAMPRDHLHEARVHAALATLDPSRSASPLSHPTRRSRPG